MVVVLQPVCSKKVEAVIYENEMTPLHPSRDHYNGLVVLLCICYLSTMYLQYIKLPCIQQSPQPNFEQREKFFSSSVPMHCIPEIPSVYIEKKSLKVWQ